MDLRHLYLVIDYWTLRGIDKRLLHTINYSGVKMLQDRIDAEGCGAVFCAARLGD